MHCNFYMFDLTVLVSDVNVFASTSCNTKVESIDIAKLDYITNLITTQSIESRDDESISYIWFDLIDRDDLILIRDMFYKFIVYSMISHQFKSIKIISIS